MARDGLRRFAYLLVLGAALSVLAWLLSEGWSYYATPLVERPRHPGYWDFKPGGRWGRTYGMVGAGLMIVMLSYSLRKRTRVLGRVGRLRTWLSFHIFCGIVGPLLVVLHSSFKVKGLVALSFWSMILVAFSGVLGRYLYVQIPRTRNGDALTLAEIERVEEGLTRRLREDLKLPAETLESLDDLARRAPSPSIPLWLFLLRLPLDGWALRWRLWRFRGRLRRLPRSVRRDTLEVCRRRAVLTHRIALWNRLQRLFHYWHVLHKPFAIIMYLFMLVHIAVVSFTGYGWW